MEQFILKNKNSKRPFRVLCVDDMKIVLDTISYYLADLGFEVHTAQNGVEGLQVLNQVQPDIVLLDLYMPEMGGIEVLEQIKIIDPDLPVIIVSGAGEIKMAIDALRHGAWDFLTKPIKDMQILNYAIFKALDRARLIRENKDYQKNLEKLVAERTEKLRQRELKLEDAQEIAHLGYWELDLKTREFNCSKEFLRILGILDINKEINFEEFMGYIHPEDRDFVNKAFDYSIRNQHVFDLIHRIISSDGMIKYVQEKCNIEYDQLANKAQRSMGIMQDITERVKFQEEIKSSLREKEILLREIHHRVKNNMQVISSMLKLQSIYIQDENAIRLIDTTVNRIHSMALIHEKLYASEDLSQVDFHGYLKELTGKLYSIYMVDSEKVTPVINIENIKLNIDKAIPLGLIFYEAVSNSLKHAFPASRTGSITVDFHKIDNTGYILSVSDNGQGFPPEIDFYNSRTFGLRLINLLAAQLNGHIEFEGKSGVTIKINFKDEKRLHPAFRMQSSQPDAIPVAGDTNGKKILIVEDEIMISLLLEKLLRKQNYNVIGALDSGEEAIDFVQKNKPDIILMDIMLKGDMDGIDAAKKIKSRMNIPVIFCTANTDDFVKNRAVKINPEGYIKKPIIEHELFGMIKKVLADRVQAGK